MADRRRRVVWTEQAQAALDEILTYVSQDSPQAARALLQKALDAAESLSTLSERGRVVPELQDESVRELLVRRYRMLYEVRSQEVYILAILHGARDFAKWAEVK
jgi:toxin ParE1/3/4